MDQKNYNLNNNNIDCDPVVEDKNKNNPLANENIGKLLIKMIIPAVIAQIVNLLYNIVDRMFIASIPNIGTLALTGVGVTFPIIILISAFASLVGMGGAPKAAIKMGQNNYNDAEEIVSNCFISLIGISIILTVFFLIFNEKLLLMFGASEQTLPYAKEYINIYILGTIFIQISLGLNPFINSQGFVNIAMKTVLIGAGFNIIFDFVFIKIFNMGVKGAALATVISQAISAIWVLSFLLKSKLTKIKIKSKYFKLKKKVMFPILALGISPFIMQSTESLLNIAFNSSLKKYGGDIAVGSMTIIATIMQCINLIAAGIGQGAQPIISFNYGAKKLDRVKKTYKLTILISIIFTTTMWLLCILKPEIFVGIFAKDNNSLMEYANISLKIYIFSVFLMGAQFACQQTFVALGQAKISLFLAILRKIVLLIPLIYILPLALSNNFITSIQKALFNNYIENKVFAIFLAEKIKIKTKYFKINKAVILPILALGVSPFIMQSTESLLSIAFNSSLKKYGGDIAVGSMTICATIMQCVGLILTGIGQGSQPIVSFNYGYGKMDRVRKTYNLAIIASILFAVVMWVLCLIKPEMFVGVFAKEDEDMMSYASITLKIYMFCSFSMGIQYTCQQVFVALGQAKVSLFLAIFRKIILLIPIIYILPAIIPDSFITSFQKLVFPMSIENKVFSVFLAEPISDFIAASTTIVLFVFTTKKLTKTLK